VQTYSLSTQKPHELDIEAWTVHALPLSVHLWHGLIQTNAQVQLAAFE
jgi:hypothetical protein